jgi:hypothetical protein
MSVHTLSSNVLSLADLIQFKLEVIESDPFGVNWQKRREVKKEGRE